MYDLFQMVFLGFVIGLTGALAPGPTLVATINASINGDWMTGLKVSLGHAIIELFIVLIIVGKKTFIGVIEKKDLHTGENTVKNQKQLH